MSFAKYGVGAAALALAATGSMTSFAPAANAQPAHWSRTLEVATTGTDTGNCHWSACQTLGYALTQASAGDTIVIQPGTYAESGDDNVVPPTLTDLTITSDGSPNSTVIDAAGNNTGLLVEASGVTVRGLTVENANLEGILAEPPMSTWPTTSDPTPANITNLTITANTVIHNDQAYNTSLPPTAACPASPTDPDDCGEGIHLLGVSWSRVTGNDINHNVGGILVSDGGLGGPSGLGIPVGPAAHNLIAGNISMDNTFDCGITLPGHDPLAVATTGADAGQPQPDIAGVYDNTIIGNVSTGNGGAGLLDAAPTPGTASYDNVFADNTATGNGNAGFTLHSHAPDQDVSGIVVVGNHLGQNNLAGDADTGVTATTGIMLLSVAMPTTILVAGNTVTDDTNGIASNSNITVTGHNRFVNVTNPLATYVPPAA
jgi:hypothetical protein